MRFYSQSFLYDDPWAIVSYAFFMRYPNPLASHVLSCDVISRTLSPSGSLVTTRLILKSGALPRWAPKGMISRAESWVVEESEVDPVGRTVRCTTKNLDHVKVMRVEERIILQQTEDGKTVQNTDARFVSGFGWGLTKKIENHGLARFKANIQRSRQGFHMILDLIRQSRMQPMTMGTTAAYMSSPSSAESSQPSSAASPSATAEEKGLCIGPESMYFPTSAARQLSTTPALPVSSEFVVCLSASPRKSLFCTLTKSGLSIWRIRPSAVLAHLSRTSTSLVEHGENVSMSWAPSGRRIVIQTTQSFLVLVTVEFDTEQVLYQSTPLAQNAQRHFLLGPGEAFPLHAITLHLEGVIRLEGTLLSVSPRDDYIQFSTRGPPAVQRVPWPGTQRDDMYATWVLNDEEFPWLEDSDGTN
ncbi:uncharacterized protein FIBRA_02342 [Fibroporia radiculosa]|uniref:PRELI/MSF1 domain-containing protein n=1 Tax=Fibroporia radiculosa TaxID=599839 RepID=J4HUS1_9APHY|nr:uncharacterized protein FIBRA_02342 [Fibroporia radiculosa]CCM00312.1 predicted protein [Fibroporia radiculosa]